LTQELKKEFGIVTIPLTMTLGEKSYVDDETLDVPQFMKEMKNCTGRIGSASPSPTLYKDAFQGSHTSFAVTLSSNLSGSYASAMSGKTLAEEEIADVHVFDSKSASAGETLIAIKIAKLISDEIPIDKIIAFIENFISEMKTYFVLENMDNLVKNGRIPKLAGKLISALNIRPIMGSNGDGKITLVSHARGQNQIIEKLADTIEKSGKATEGQSLVIAHCNNPALAEKLRNEIQIRYHFKEIITVPTRGLSSMYANDMGVVLAF
jgi:DegV family protein with EDD domain